MLNILLLILLMITPIYQELTKTNKKNQTITMTQNNNKNRDNQKRTVEDWKEKLSPISFHVLRENGTERPFTGRYFDYKENGIYYCEGCKHPLFDSETKFDSDCGWPSFYDIKENANVKLVSDKSHRMIRTEVRCSNCDGHLGHVFEDGPKPTGLRYCINSAALHFDKNIDTTSAQK